MSVDVSASNSTTGAGAIDSWHSVVTECEQIKNEHGADRAATAVEIGVSVVSAALDTVALIMDPFAKLIAAGLGWLIEHVSFLRKGLDELAGNPDAIKAMADELHQTGQKLRDAATDLDNQLAKITGWTGDAADRFHSVMEGHKGNVDAAGRSVDIVGYVVETTMAIVAAVRALLRDMITTILGDFIATMLIALATAVITFGASLVAGTAKCVAEGAVEAADMAAKVDKLTVFAGRAGVRMHNLISSLKNGKTGSEATGAGHELDDLPTGGTGRPPGGENEPAAPGTNGHGDPVGDGTAPANTSPGNTPHENDDPPTDTAAHGDDAPHGTTPQDPPGTPAETPPSATGSHGDDEPNTTTPSGSQANDDPLGDWANHYQHYGDDTPGSTTPSAHGDETGTPPADPATHGDDEPDTTTPSNAGDDPPAQNPPGQTGNPPGEDPNTAPHNDNGGPPANQPGPGEGEGGGSGDPKSALASKDIKFMKAHEKVLQDFFPASYDKMKFMDNFVKDKFPNQYPIIKGLADAKSSKNFVGWIAKNAVQVDKQLTDIHIQAEQAWAQQQQQDGQGGSQDNPDART